MLYVTKIQYDTKMQRTVKFITTEEINYSVVSEKI